ncbi:type II toxin-antitoxin system mRNA interferase toxin, RelE/StbE family [Blautia hydrogenotrophica]|uniref:type II toxin-antitoxin system mRNA interferase toxin, RelE/StbE family n=1 Tax=Blautia hydrogenotrophica TaxID=53443 RepID=UPI00258D93E8|nr:type II toxin-antitoxin system mRNA interferase toxin, RelE/StbE family [Blautia hydrogenotrophica]
MPEKNRDYALARDYISFQKCQLTPDWLLVYRVENGELEFFLFSTGTHSDLFA